MTDRETLASMIYANFCCSPEPVTLNESFIIADRFIKYAETQREPKKNEVIPCQNCKSTASYTVTGSPYIRCAKCHYVVETTPPKMAREWWIIVNSLTTADHFKPENTNDWIKVREILDPQ